MKAFLKTFDGVYPLAPKITSIGSEKCDFINQHLSIDPQHALIEYQATDGIFTIKDLDSHHGTFVNEERINNEPFPLKPGDVLRFGSSSTSYTFLVERSFSNPTSPAVNIHEVGLGPSVTTRPLSTQLPQITSSQREANRLTHIHTLPAWAQVGQVVQLPRPPPTTSRLESRAPSLPVASPLKRGSNSHSPEASAPPISDGNGLEMSLDKTSTVITDLRQKPPSRGSSVSRQGRTSNAVEEPSLPTPGRPLSAISKASSGSISLGLVSPAPSMRSATPPTPVPYSKPQLTPNEKIRKLKQKIGQLKAQLEAAQNNSPVLEKLHQLESEVVERQTEVMNLRYQLHQYLQRSQSAAKEKEASAESKSPQQKQSAPSEPLIDSETLSQLEHEVKSKQEEILSLTTQLNEMTEKCRIQEEVAVRLNSEHQSQEEKLSQQLSQTQDSLTQCQTEMQNQQQLNEQLQLSCDEKQVKIVELENAQNSLETQLQEVKDKLCRVDQMLKDLFSSSEMTYEGSAIDNLDQLANHIQQLVQDQHISRKHDTVREDSIRELTSVIGQLRMIMQDGSEDASLEHEKWRSHLQEVETMEHSLKPLCQELSRVLEEENSRKTSAKEQNDLNKKVHEEAVIASVSAALSTAEEGFTKRLEELQKSLEDQLSQAVQVERQKLDELNKSIASLQETISIKENEISQMSHHSHVLEKELQESRCNVHDLRQQLASLSTEREETQLQVTLQQKAREDQYAAELDAYREQVRQHAITICAMSERTNSVTKTNENQKEENTQLRREVEHLKTVIADLELHAKTSSIHGLPNAPESSYKEKVYSNGDVHFNQPQLVLPLTSPEMVNMERSLVALRQENQQLKNNIREKEDCIKGLKKDLAGAAARLSDMRGELTEEQKEKMALNEKRAVAAERDLIDSQALIAKLTDLVEQWKTQSTAKDTEIQGLTKILDQHRDQLKSMEEKLKSSEESHRTEYESLSKALMKRRGDAHVTEELAAIGAQCRGDKHAQVITHQKEAISELRQKLRVSAGNKQPILDPSNPAVQQVVLLQREIAALRSELALREAHQAVPNLSALRENVRRQQTAFDEDKYTAQTSALKDSYESEKQHPTDRFSFNRSDDGDVSRMRQDALASLELAEYSYFQLIKAVSTAFNLEPPDNLTKMTTLSREQHEIVRNERERFNQSLIKHIQVLRDKLERKDALLSNSELDEVKRRQAEELVNKKQEQLDNLIRELRSKNEEVDLLRETLQRTKDMLTKEKQLNEAIRSNKPLIVERPLTKEKSSSPHCLPNNAMSPEKRLQTAMNEKLKRKDYEIRVLKQELVAREEELSKANMKLSNFGADEIHS